MQLFKILVAGLLGKPDTPFVKEAAALLRTSLTTVKDADTNMRNLLGYPLDNTLQQSEAQEFLQGGLKDVAKEILAVSKTILHTRLTDEIDWAASAMWVLKVCRTHRTWCARGGQGQRDPGHGNPHT